MPSTMWPKSTWTTLTSSSSTGETGGWISVRPSCLVCCFTLCRWSTASWSTIRAAISCPAFVARPMVSSISLLISSSNVIIIIYWCCCCVCFQMQDLGCAIESLRCHHRLCHFQFIHYQFLQIFHSVILLFLLCWLLHHPIRKFNDVFRMIDDTSYLVVCQSNYCITGGGESHRRSSRMRVYDLKSIITTFKQQQQQREDKNRQQHRLPSSSSSTATAAVADGGGDRCYCYSGDGSDLLVSDLELGDRPFSDLVAADKYQIYLLLASSSSRIDYLQQSADASVRFRLLMR